MAIKVETLEVDLEVAGASKAASDVKNVTNNTDKMTRSLKSAALQGAALFAALKVGARVLGDVYNAVAAQDTANRRLKDSLRITGAEVETTFKRFEEFAGEVQKLTGLADDSTLALLSQATQMGLTADEAEKAAQQAIGLSVAFGTDVTSALKIAALAGEGEYEMLGRLVPSLRSAETEAEKAAIAQGVLNNAWMIAQENTQTLEGSTTNLKNSYGDLIEAIVDAAVDMDNLITLINDASAAFQKVAGSEALGAAIDGLTKFKDIIMLTINPLGGLIKGVRALINAQEDAENWDAENDYWSRWLVNEEKIKEETKETTVAIVEQAEAVKTLMFTQADAYAENLTTYIESQQQIAAYEQAAHAEKMRKIEEEKRARLDAAMSMYGTMKNIVQTYYANEIQAAGDNEEKLQEIREKQFRANQAFGIADTIINTASSIMKVLAQGGLFAIPIAAAMGALGAAQIGVIASAKPSFATGGSYVVPPGYEADNFPVNAASGETVTVSRPGQEGGQMLNAVINIDGYEFGRVITRLFEDRKATISGVRVA